MQIRILVVDDDQDQCDYFKLVLAKDGYEVVTLTDPTQTVELLKQSDFHLVVLDMEMPTMRGPEVLEAIRRVDTDVAVVVATAYPTVDTAVASLRGQASDYIKKPATMEHIL